MEPKPDTAVPFGHGTVPGRLWRKVKVAESGCWEWSGTVAKSGYGRAWDARTCKTVRAHRLFYELAVGSIPGDLVVRHDCDNKRCVNLAHLQIGTQADNIRDASERRLLRHGAGHSRTHLSDEDIREIRSRYATGGITQTQLGLEYGVNNGSISRLISGQTWRHVA